MFINKYTGPGRLQIEILTEANVSAYLRIKVNTHRNQWSLKVYMIGAEEVPHLVTPKSEMLAVSPHISYRSVIAPNRLK